MQILICVLDNSSWEVGQAEEVTLKQGEKADLTQKQNYKCYRKNMLETNEQCGIKSCKE